MRSEQIDNFPEYMVCYAYYGEPDYDVTDEDIKLYEEWRERNGYGEFLSIDGEHYFSSHPAFGLACDVVPVSFSVVESVQNSRKAVKSGVPFKNRGFDLTGSEIQEMTWRLNSGETVEYNGWTFEKDLSFDTITATSPEGKTYDGFKSLSGFMDLYEYGDIYNSRKPIKSSKTVTYDVSVRPWGGMTVERLKDLGFKDANSNSYDNVSFTYTTNEPSTVAYKKLRKLIEDDNELGSIVMFEKQIIKSAFGRDTVNIAERIIDNIENYISPSNRYFTHGDVEGYYDNEVSPGDASDILKELNWKLIHIRDILEKAIDDDDIADTDELDGLREAIDEADSFAKDMLTAESYNSLAMDIFHPIIRNFNVIKNSRRIYSSKSNILADLNDMESEFEVVNYMKKVFDENGRSELYEKFCEDVNNSDDVPGAVAEKYINNIFNSRKINSSQKGFENVAEGTKYDDYHIDTTGMGILDVEHIINEIEGRGNQAVLTVKTSDGATQHTQFNAKDWKAYKDAVNGVDEFSRNSRTKGAAITDVWVTEVEGGSYVRNSCQIESSTGTIQCVYVSDIPASSWNKELALSAIKNHVTNYGYYDYNGRKGCCIVGDFEDIYNFIESNGYVVDEDYIYHWKGFDWDSAKKLDKRYTGQDYFDRQIKSARYIATDPETGEVLGSADTYEEAVNEWGEDVTITDSEAAEGEENMELFQSRKSIKSDLNVNDEAAYWDGMEDGINGLNPADEDDPDYMKGWRNGRKRLEGHNYKNRILDDTLASSKKSETTKQTITRLLSSVISGEMTEDEAAEEIAQANDVNIGYARNIFSEYMNDKERYLTSGMLELGEALNVDFDPDGDIDTWFVDFAGDEDKPAPTLGGELVKAARYIIRAFRENGEKIGWGYARETLNPAARFIIDNTDFGGNDELKSMIEGDVPDDNGYEKWINSFEEDFADYLRDHSELFEKLNNTDFMDSANESDEYNTVDEFFVEDDEGNQYWFQNVSDGWTCVDISYDITPDYDEGDIITAEDYMFDNIDFNEEFGEFMEAPFEYSWEDGDGESVRISNVRLMNGLYEIDDYISNNELMEIINDGTLIYDKDGNELKAKDIF